MARSDDLKKFHREGQISDREYRRAGGICADLFSFPATSTMSIANVVVGSGNPLPTIQSINLTNAIATIRSESLPPNP